MRDQEVDLACLAEEGEDLRPMRLRYGVTADEAAHHEPLEVSLNQEEAELTVDDDGTWDEVEPEGRGVERTHSAHVPDDLDEQQVAPAAEHEAVHIENA
jgi:hypothetical protein